MAKRYRLLAAILMMLLLLAGCTPKQSAEDALEIGAALESPLPAAAGAPQEQPAQAIAANTKAQDGTVSIVDAVAAYFPGVLYGAVAYRNDSSAPVALSAATFIFRYAGGSQTSDFTPIAANSDVVMPGETAYCTLWLPYDDARGVPENLTVEAELTAQGVAQSAQQLTVGDARLVQNYPGFATLSGSLKNPGVKNCDLNVVYAGMYDENGKLLAVWYFTRNAVLQPGEDTAFVVHLQALPMEGLAERTKEIRFRAFGI